MGVIHHMELDGVPIDMEEVRDREFDRRRHAWDTAKTMVDQLVELYGLEVIRSSATLFVAPGLVGRAEQYSDLILETADWLLGNAD